MINPRQQRFCQEYIIDLNATQATIRAGYAGGKTAQVTGCRLISNANIKTEIARLQAEIAARMEYTAEKAREDLLRLGAKAEADGQIANALRAIEIHTKLAGLIIDKVESKAEIIDHRAEKPDFQATKAKLRVVG